MKRGVDEVKRKLQDCCAGGLSPGLSDKLDKAKFVADPSLGIDCGAVTLPGFLTNTIKINPNVLFDPGLSQECCAPSGLIAHELRRLQAGGFLTPFRETEANRVQYKCFGCTESISIQDYLKRRQRPPGTIFGGM